MRTILLVDDDLDTRQNMADLFDDVGYAIETAESGANALAKARRQLYDLALLDIRMPGMDGITLCRRLKEMQPGLAALIVSAYAEGMREQAHAAGALRVFSKPVDFRKLLALIEDVLVAE